MFMGRMAVAVAGALALAFSTSGAAQVLPAGKVAPKWTGTAVGGKEIKSQAYAGKVVLLNFFNNY